MRLIRTIIFCICLPWPVFADTLYQGNVGGYSTPVGVGLGASLTSGYSPYGVNTVGGYTAGVSPSGVPYDSFTYPYSSGCCGCNSCNNCSTSYYHCR